MPSRAVNAGMGYTVEVVKMSPGSEIVADEVFALATCPDCRHDVLLQWPFCPGCGNPLLEEAGEACIDTP